MIKVGILTISDKASKGMREDKSGEVVRELIGRIDGRAIKYEIVPDEKRRISERLRSYCDDLKVDLVLTTGGTGLSPRDLTPEATKEVIDREVPGITEAMRVKGYQSTPYAMLSRAVAGIRGRTLIINLPGSPKAVRESLEIILPVIHHALEVLRGEPHKA